MKRIFQTRCSHIALAASALCASAVVTVPALAQDAAGADETTLPVAEETSFEEIVVTAQRREERLQQVPLAITAISGDTLANQGSSDLRGISQIAPSLNVSTYPNSTDTLALNMRGQGVADAGQITKDGGVGLYIDGFYISRPQGALLDLGDPERIEVLRGPQGTLYGRNTTGGAVNIITQKPTGELGASTSLRFGSRNLVRSFATIDLPAFANIAVKGTFLYSHQDGWVKNPDQPNDFHEFGQLAGRVAVRWTPTDDFTLDYAFDRGRITTTQPYYVNPDLVGAVPGYSSSIDKSGLPVDLGLSKSFFTDHQLTLTWDATDSLTLRSLTGFRDTKSNQDVNYGFAQGFPTFPFTVAQQHRYKSKAFTQEVQLIGSISDMFQYTGGLYYFDEDASHLQNQQIPQFGTFDSSRDVDTKSTSKAAYLQATIIPPILDNRLKLTLGGRYTEDERNARRSSSLNGAFFETDVRNDQSFNNFSPSVNLAMQWTPELMTYLRYSRGYKAGGSGEAAANFATGTFGPEKVEAWEAGLKSQFFDRTVTLNLSAFYNKFDDLQVDFTTDPIDLTQVSTANAGKAEIKGLEVELAWRPTRSFGVNVSWAHLDPNLKSIIAPAGTNFDPSVNPASPLQVGDDATDYFTLPFVPRNAVTVSGDWAMIDDGARKLTAYASYSYQSRMYTSSVAGPGVAGRDFWLTDPREVVNARLVWEQELAGADVEIAAFVNNLFDNRSREFVIGVGAQVDNLTGPGGYYSQTAPWSEPRVIGGNVKVTF